MSPVADFIQRRLTRVPRGIAVIAVIVPVIIICALIIARVLISLVEIPGAASGRPAGSRGEPTDRPERRSAWFDARGIAVDVAGAFHTFLTEMLKGMVEFMVALFGGAASAFGTVIDAIIVVTLAVFMAIDRDKIMRPSTADRHQRCHNRRHDRRPAQAQGLPTRCRPA